MDMKQFDAMSGDAPVMITYLDRDGYTRVFHLATRDDFLQEIYAIEKRGDGTDFEIWVRGPTVLRAVVFSLADKRTAG